MSGLQAQNQGFHVHEEAPAPAIAHHGGMAVCRIPAHVHLALFRVTIAVDSLCRIGRRLLSSSGISTTFFHHSLPLATHLKGGIMYSVLRGHVAGLVLVVTVVLPVMAFSQSSEAGRSGHHEVPNDPYIASPREAMGTSPAYRFLAPGIVTSQVNVNAQGQNIVGDAANEPSIAVNPLDPNFMVVGWRQFNTVTSDFRQAGYGFTTDAGGTWTFPGVIQPGVFRSDPVVDFDASGNFFYNSLTLSGSDYICAVFKSTTGGSSWDGGVAA